MSLFDKRPMAAFVTSGSFFFSSKTSQKATCALSSSTIEPLAFCTRSLTHHLSFPPPSITSLPLRRGTGAPGYNYSLVFSSLIPPGWCNLPPLFLHPLYTIFTMAGRSRGNSAPFAWTTVFYLLLVLVAPLAFLHTANAQDEQQPIREDLGDGMSSSISIRTKLIFPAVIGIDLGTTYSYVSDARGNFSKLTCYPDVSV